MSVKDEDSWLNQFQYLKVWLQSDGVLVKLLYVVCYCSHYKQLTKSANDVRAVARLHDLYVKAMHAASQLHF